MFTPKNVELLWSLSLFCFYTHQHQHAFIILKCFVEIKNVLIKHNNDNDNDNRVWQRKMRLPKLYTTKATTTTTRNDTESKNHTYNNCVIFPRWKCMQLTASNIDSQLASEHKRNEYSFESHRAALEATKRTQFDNSDSNG